MLRSNFSKADSPVFGLACPIAKPQLGVGLTLSMTKNATRNQRQNHAAIRLETLFLGPKILKKTI